MRLRSSVVVFAALTLATYGSLRVAAATGAYRIDDIHSLGASVLSQ